jgi:deoxyadenosine/deoxycytidine kinase
MQDGFIDPLDFQTYEMAYSIMCRSLLPPTLLVYLDVQPQTAFDRMKSRNRKAEAGVPLDYLVKLRKGYLELLKEAESALLPWAHAVRILRIPFDFNIHSPEEWDAVALTVKDSCRKGNDTYFG